MESFQKRERERKQREKRRLKEERKLERAQDKADAPSGPRYVDGGDHVGDGGSSSPETQRVSETDSGPNA